MEFEATKIQVVEALKKNGNYDELKAKLRASVFQALQGSLKPTSNLEKTQEDRDIVFMIQDFCRLKNLPQTSAILEAEWGSREESVRINRPDQNHPYLALLLKSYFDPKPVGVAKARIVPPPPPSAPKINAPSAPLPQDPSDISITVPPAVTVPQTVTETGNAEVTNQDPLPPKNTLKPLQSISKPDISNSEPSPEQKVLMVDVDQAIAARKHEHIDTPSGNPALNLVIAPEEPMKPPRQRYRPSDIGGVYLNAANQALMDDDADTEEVISSDRSASDPKKGMENVDQFEVFSLEDISDGSEVVRERTLTKEDEELAQIERDKLKSQAA